MKYVLILIVCLSISSCTVVGFVSDVIVGNAFENSEDKNVEANYNNETEKTKNDKNVIHEFPLTETGWVIDMTILKNIFSPEPDDSE